LHHIIIEEFGFLLRWLSMNFSSHFPIQPWSGNTDNGKEDVKDNCRSLLVGRNDSQAAVQIALYYFLDDGTEEAVIFLETALIFIGPYLAFLSRLNELDNQLGRIAILLKAAFLSRQWGGSHSSIYIFFCSK